MTLAPFIALWLSAAGIVHDPEATIETELAALEAAWRGGQVARVAVHADQAVAMIQDSACPLRADVALAAFMGAFANTLRDTPGSPSYLFWVASQAHSVLDVLPDAAAEAADHLRSEPGEYIKQDSLFLASPYRSVESLQTGCAPSRLDPSILNAEPVHATHAFAALRAPTGREGGAAWRRLEVIFAYPDREVAGLIALLQEFEGRALPHAPVWRVTFAPCASFGTAELTSVELCREGAAP